jgi:DNA-binding NarL/FixJ family response regulator
MRLALLTERERTILTMLARGSSNQEISTSLALSVGTVKNHISSILSKLDVRDRTQAALWARQHGLG